jgi:chromosome segregation ATPase
MMDPSNPTPEAYAELLRRLEEAQQLAQEAQQQAQEAQQQTQEAQQQIQALREEGMYISCFVLNLKACHVAHYFEENKWEFYIMKK